MNPVSPSLSAPFVVIVAEDEPLIRMMISEVLEEAGFEVVEAKHAAEALAILRVRAPEIRILFTDIHMPGAMNGLELSHHARDHWPWISLLVTSGKAHPTARELPAGGRFIPKPYAPQRVVDQIRELMDAA